MNDSASNDFLDPELVPCSIASQKKPEDLITAAPLRHIFLHRGVPALMRVSLRATLYLLSFATCHHLPRMMSFNSPRTFCSRNFGRPLSISFILFVIINRPSTQPFRFDVRCPYSTYDAYSVGLYIST